MKVAIGITGASGAIYARQLIHILKDLDVETTVIFTKNGKEVSILENEFDKISSLASKVEENDNFFSFLASGSSGADAMVIVPCSNSMLARIANGISTDLCSRAAEVMLKERRKLIIAHRETPLSIVTANNIATLSNSGAIITPLSPSFYSSPRDIEELCMTVTERIVSLLGFTIEKFKWGK